MYTISTLGYCEYCTYFTQSETNVYAFFFLSSFICFVPSFILNVDFFFPGSSLQWQRAGRH